MRKKTEIIFLLIFRDYMGEEKKNIVLYCNHWKKIAGKRMLLSREKMPHSRKTNIPNKASEKNQLIVVHMGKVCFLFSQSQYTLQNCLLKANISRKIGKKWNNVMKKRTVSAIQLFVLYFIKLLRMQCNGN